MYNVNFIDDAGTRGASEDVLLIKGDVFGVFDGLSSLVESTGRNGRTGGKIAAEVASQAFANCTKPLDECARDANRAIRAAMQKAQVPLGRKEALWACAAAIARLRTETVELLTIGDCVVLGIDAQGQPRPMLEYDDHDSETLVRLSRLPTNCSADSVRTLLVELRRSLNVTYGALSGESETERFFKHVRIPLADTASIILSTDGLLIPKEDPATENDWRAMGELYRHGGLGAILRHVRQLEKSDPDCRRYPRYRRHDDIAAISIDL